MAAKLFYLPFPTAFGSNGLPVAGAKLYFYETLTLTPADVYTASDLVTEHAHPVVADGAGRHAAIYLDDTVDYRLIIKDAAGNTLTDVDPLIPGTIGGALPGEDAEEPVFTVATGLPGTNVLISGTYPNLLLTIPRGTAGASGALSDGDMGDIVVSGTGATLTIDANVVTFAKLVAAGSAGFIGATGAGNYAHRSYAQTKTDLSLNNVDNTADTAKPVSTAQQTALDLKQNIIPREQAVVSAATVTPTFLNDQVNITAQAAALALANPTGTAVPNHGIVIRIKDNGTARAISYGSEYRALGVTLPATTAISKTLYLGMIFNAADTRWDVVSVAQQA